MRSFLLTVAFFATLPALSGASSVTNIEPDTAVAGGSDFAVYVSGAGFLAGASVRFNGTALATTVFNSNQMLATVPASLLTAAGTASITVTNLQESPSNAIPFVIAATAGVPVLASASISVGVGGAGAVVYASGSNLAPNAVLSWNSTLLPTSFYFNQLYAQVPAALAVTPGPVSISAANRGNLVPSNSTTFTVPAPRLLTSLSPASVAPVGGDFTLMLSGTGFAQGDQIILMTPTGEWFTTNTTLIGGTLQGTVPAAAIAVAGNAQVFVRTSVSSSTPGCAAASPSGFCPSFASTNQLLLPIGNVPCSYTLNAGGQAFPAEGGSGTVSVTVNPTCPWILTPGVPEWVSITSASFGAGNGMIAYTVTPNQGGVRSAVLTIAGIPFSIEQLRASAGGLNNSGLIAHFVSGGTWKTAFNFINLDPVAAQTRVSFFDSDGAPVLLPLTFPQALSSTGPLLAATLDRTLNGGATLVLESTGADADPALIGSAQMLSSGNVNAFAIFSNPALKWEAAVPMENRNATTYTLAFDNTGSISTGVAVSNLSSGPAFIQITVNDDSGALLGISNLSLQARGHSSFQLNQSFLFTVGKRGIMRFAVAQGVQIGIVGLRANGAALTTLPVLANTDRSGGSITHVAYNGGFSTLFTLMNTGSAAADATLSLFDSSGSPLSAPLQLLQSGSTVTTSTLTRTLAPGASLLVALPGQDALPAIVGSALVTSAGNVGGFAIFRWTTFGQEASVPLETRTAAAYVLPYDNTNGLGTGLALTNVLAQGTSVGVIVRDDTGAVLQTGTLPFAGRSHMSFMLSSTYVTTAGKRGTVEFDAPADGRISAIGLRFRSDGTLTTIPVIAK